MALILSGFLMFILLCSTPSYARPSDTVRHNLRKGVNGGYVCLACTTVVALVEQLSVVHNQTFVAVFHTLCDELPSLYKKACLILGEFFIPQIINLITKKATPDVICRAVHLCYQEKGQPLCRAFPPGKDFHEDVLQSRKKVFAKLFHESANFYDPENPTNFDPCSIPGVKILCDLLKRVFIADFPLVDLDNDAFSASVKAWRGSSWRGKDCDDFNARNHPGAKPTDGDVNFDSNCNGIYGRDPTTGKPYEDLFCKDTGYLGVIVLGDSAAAHFHIPPEWLTARLISSKVFQHVAFIAGNEADWPQLSAITGYLNNSRWPTERGHADSIYLRLWQRNHCNHRDYQNLAKNGADSFTANSMLIKSMARDQKLDQPALVFYVLIGNDVCQDTLDEMTTPEEMRKNVLETLHGLDKRLPNGSHVILSGLVDGRILYDTVHNRMHPLGKLRGDLTYEQFYNFLNCLQVSLCSTWLNSNETIRNETSKRAGQLSAVLKKVAETTKYENFDVFYFDLPFEQVIKELKAEGGKVYELFEAADGFHPTLKAQALTAKTLWQTIESKIPHVLGKVNSNNVLIEKMFGDQGGY